MSSSKHFIICPTYVIVRFFAAGKLKRCQVRSSAVSFPLSVSMLVLWFSGYREILYNQDPISVPHGKGRVIHNFSGVCQIAK